jgi:hypothetical protein
MLSPVFLLSSALATTHIFITNAFTTAPRCSRLIPTGVSIHSRQQTKANSVKDLSDFGTANNFDELEKEVYASTQAKLDIQKLKNSLADQENNVPKRTAIMAEKWKISLAAAASVGVLFQLSTSSNIWITLAVFLMVFLIANQDPTEEEGAAGALARLLGRITIQSVETTKPKLKAVARICVGDDDLQQRITVLEKENLELKQWKQQRLEADALLSQYGLDELKRMARENRLQVSGTKVELLLRLLEHNILVTM